MVPVARASGHGTPQAEPPRTAALRAVWVRQARVVQEGRLDFIY